MARAEDRGEAVLTCVNDFRRGGPQKRTSTVTGAKTMMSFLNSPELLMQTPVLIFLGMTLSFAVALLYTSITDRRQDS